MSTTSAASLSRLSLNQITTEQWSLPEVVAGCVRHGVPYCSVWRHKLAETGVAPAASLIRSSGVKVSSLCRGGWFPAATAKERRQRLDDNLRAVDEAASLGTDVLVLVCGPAPDRDLAAARQMVSEGVASTVGHASSCGVKLAIEPLHPMFAADRSVVVTLAQALDIAEQFAPEAVGVVVDVYHVWWDPDLQRQLQRAGGRVLGFHVSDWVAPVPDHVYGRVMMGDGVIELRKLRAAVDAIGYEGPIEVEVLNKELWERPGDDVLDLVVQRYSEHV